MTERRYRKRANGQGSVYQMPDGRWVAAISIAPGKRKIWYRRTQREALARLREVLADRADGNLVIDERQTVAEHCALWLEATRNTVRPATLARYQAYARNQIEPRVGRKRLAEVRPQDLQQLYSDCLADGLSPTTVHHLHGAIHTMLEQAVRWRAIPRNPAALVDAPKRRSPERTVLTEQQARRLIAAARSHRLEALLILAVTAGMREGELAGLRWSDVFLDTGVIEITVQMARAEHGYAFADPKSRSRRRIRLSTLAIDALRRRWDIQQQERLRAAAKWHDTGLVFTRPDGQRVAQQHLASDVLAPMLAEAGLPHLRLHDLRHTFATLSLRAHVPMKIVQEAMGHSSLGQTMDLYSHAADDLQAEIAAAMDALFRESA